MIHFRDRQFNRSRVVAVHEPDIIREAIKRTGLDCRVRQIVFEKMTNVELSPPLLIDLSNQREPQRIGISFEPAPAIQFCLRVASGAARILRVLPRSRRSETVSFSFGQFEGRFRPPVSSRDP